MAKRLRQTIKIWNTKLHMYLGLFFLLFLWLFSLTGFLMNHPAWFGGMPDRVAEDRPVEMPAGGDDREKALALMEQLDLQGEYLQSPQKAGHFLFRVLRPSRRYFVDVDLETQQAVVRTVTPQLAGRLGDLHTTNGVRAIWRESPATVDWAMTRVWVFAMDALGIAMILMVISSLYMWIQLDKKRIPGAIALLLGCAVCALFIWGLA
jgi:hypothetical protein